MLGEASGLGVGEIFEEAGSRVSGVGAGEGRSGSGNLEEPGEGAEATRGGPGGAGEMVGRVGRVTDARKAEGECFAFYVMLSSRHFMGPAHYCTVQE